MPELRQTIAEIRLMDLTRNEAIVDEMSDYFERRDDHNRIRHAIKQRFGVGITTEIDASNSDQQYKVYSRGEFNIQVDAGLIEAINIGFGQKVVSALATLFSEPGQRYELTSETTEDTSKESSLIGRIRKNGGYDACIVDVDQKSIQVGSAAVFVRMKSNKLEYQMIKPSDVRIYWPKSVMDDGVQRAPDYRDIEDAYAVVLRLSKADELKHNYLAIFGRSEDWPDGRWVEYVAGQQNTKLPQPGEIGISDYTIKGSIANPLSYFANRDGANIEVPDYPIAIITGPTSDNSTPFPVYTSLFEDDIEFTMTAAHILAKANSAAGGVDVIEQDNTGLGLPLPRTLDGAVSCLPGQKYRHESKNAQDVKLAYEVVKMEMTDAAFGWSVPDYMMGVDENAFDNDSGVALEIKTRPLVKSRIKREKKNRAQVEKIFLIERALINLHLEEPGKEKLLSCEMNWEAGPLDIPENKKEKSERIISLLDKGVIDIIAAIRIYYNFSTDAEAIEEYERMKSRKAQYPPLKEEPKLQRGLFATNTRNQQNA